MVKTGAFFKFRCRIIFACYNLNYLMSLPCMWARHKVKTIQEYSR